MPFQSESQRRLLWAKHPKIAAKWAAEYPNQKNLPMHKKKGAVKRLMDYKHKSKK